MAIRALFMKTITSVHSCIPTCPIRPCSTCCISTSTAIWIDRDDGLQSIIILSEKSHQRQKIRRRFPATEISEHKYQNTMHLIGAIFTVGEFHASFKTSSVNGPHLNVSAQFLSSCLNRGIEKIIPIHEQVRF